MGTFWILVTDKAISTRINKFITYYFKNFQFEVSKMDVFRSEFIYDMWSTDDHNGLKFKSTAHFLQRTSQILQIFVNIRFWVTLDMYLYRNFMKDQFQRGFWNRNSRFFFFFSKTHCLTDV